MDAAKQRSHYLSSTWPHHFGRDLYETQKVGALWIVTLSLGTVSLGFSILSGSTMLAAVVNIVAMAAIAAVHLPNAVRCRRRRSLMIGVAALVAAALSAQRSVGGRYSTDVCWAALAATWAIAAVADVRYRESTYLRATRTKGVNSVDSLPDDA
jgi:hypothetical protein